MYIVPERTGHHPQSFGDRREQVSGFDISKIILKTWSENSQLLAIIEQPGKYAPTRGMNKVRRTVIAPIIRTLSLPSSCVRRSSLTTRFASLKSTFSTFLCRSSRDQREPHPARAEPVSSRERGAADAHTLIEELSTTRPKRAIRITNSTGQKKGAVSLQKCSPVR